MIERTVARRPGECHLCGDLVNPGDEVVAGDADDPYLHPRCLERDIELGRREDERRAEARLDTTAWLNEGRLV